MSRRTEQACSSSLVCENLHAAFNPGAQLPFRDPWCHALLPVPPASWLQDQGLHVGVNEVQPDSEACQHMLQVPYTPIIPLLYGLRASLDLLASEGFDNVVKRHHR